MWEVTLTLCTCFLAIIYLYLTRTHKYWSSLGVPGPKPLPFFGTYLGQFKTPFQESEIHRYQKYGKIYGIYDGAEPGLIVGRPDLIKEIMCGKIALDVFPNRRAVKTTHPVMSKFLSSLEDDAWKRVRSITAPTFSSGKLKSIIPVMEEASGELMTTLATLSDTKADVDLKDLFGTYTMQVIARTSFATIPNFYFVSQASQLFTFPFWRKFLDYTVPMWFLELINFQVLPHAPMQFFRDITINLIRHRREHNEEHTDFLQLLMSAEKEQENGSSKFLTEDEILAQAVLFFSVGFETSSQLLAYTAYCLALNPECQEKAYQEIMNSEDEALPYLNALIDESLRLYSPVLRMERRANQDYLLGDTGITVKKGMIVGIPVWALHHSEEYYPDPFKFDPERFLLKNKDKIVPGTFIPFGDGVRNCIGSRFALLESRLAMKKVIKCFKFIPSPNTKLEFFPTGRPLLGPRAIVVKVEKRN